MTKLNKCQKLNLAFFPPLSGNNHHLLFTFHLNAWIILSLLGLHFIKPQFTYKFAYTSSQVHVSQLTMKCLLTCETYEKFKEPYKSTFQVSKRKKKRWGEVWDFRGNGTLQT